jgi:aminoglycoside phosphotransferase (APT) family kinase protein
VIAALHTVDFVQQGLGSYGKPGNYFERQIGRWSRQYQASITQPIAEMDQLMAWLPQHIPAMARDERLVAIVHGDYRLDNLMFDPVQPRVIAVLDWELSTLGDPLADFTYHLMGWEMPSSDPTRPSLAQLTDAQKTALGIPTRDEYVARYCALTGRSGLPELDYYFAYNAFRLAGIIQGIVGRVRDGTASNAAAAQNEGRVAPLAQFAFACALRAGLQG